MADIKKTARIKKQDYANLVRAIQDISAARAEKRKGNLEYKLPDVMNKDGQWVNATEIIQQYQKVTTDAAAVKSYDSIFPAVGNGLSAYMQQMDNLLIDNWFMGYAQLSFLQQNKILSTVCDKLANGVTSKWIEFVSHGSNNKTDKIKQLEEAFERFNVKEIFTKAVRFGYSHGACQLYPKIKGDEDELYKPLNLNELKISKGSLEYFTVIEPQWYVAIKFNTWQPLTKNFYKPQAYSVIGTEVHYTRLIKFVPDPCPDILKPMYLFGGFPLTQKIMADVADLQLTRNVITEILQRYNLSIFKGDIAAINSYTSAYQNSSLANRLQAFALSRDNLGVLLIDKEEEFIQINMQLGGLADLFIQKVEYVSGVSEIPVTVLWGTSAKGLNATGEGDMNTWLDKLRVEQSKVTSQLNLIMHFIMLNEFGEIDPEITFVWKNLEVASELEKSTIRSATITDTINLNQAGVVTFYEAREKLKSDLDSGWDNLEMMEEDYMNQESPTEISSKSDENNTIL